jgi:septum formation protein
VTLPRLVLASQSPARLATLRSAGVEAEVVVSGVAENGIDAGSPALTAQLLARMKAEAVADQLAGAAALVVGCDSVLELDGRAYGKPASADDAVQRWRRMRGTSGILHTGHYVIRLPDRAAVGQVASTTVRFAHVSDEEIAAYVATSEPLQVAGAFTLDGLGGAFVDGVEGDHHAVVGLSLPLLRRLLAGLGVRWTDLWVRLPDG